MEIILHRRNTIKDLLETPTKYGIEIDLRAFKQKIVIHHEPFLEGEVFEKWLEFYYHKTLILNIKEEGIEFEILKILKKNNINNFFLLDQSFPSLIKLIKSGENRTAFRISKFESINSAFKLKEKPDWIWVDFFEQYFFEKKEFKRLKDVGYKICLVSPELLGYEKNATEKICKRIAKERFLIDAVCTKFPDLWETCKYKY